jgi:hypothetical protein
VCASFAVFERWVLARRTKSILMVSFSWMGPTSRKSRDVGHPMVLEFGRGEEHKVPPLPQIIAFAMICSGRDDRVVAMEGANMLPGTAIRVCPKHNENALKLLWDG